MSQKDPLRTRLKSLYKICASHHDNSDNQQSLSLSQEGLLDGFLSLYEECSHDNLARNQQVAVFSKKYESAVSEAQDLMIKATDFEVKNIIGRGHFGVVQVVKEEKLEKVYAMKVIRKNDILSQPEISFYQEERDIMALAVSRWITRLHYAFQDKSNLYLVMDFHPGGDLLSLLARHDDVFEEDMARFYLAEMAVAINDLHGMGYVHRDIKPENILLDHGGHIKLADFGSAAKMSIDLLVSSRMPVGTPDYVAPELLTSLNSTRGPRTYSVEVDWWSLGICAYEMMYGKTPFTDNYGSMVTTYSNIMDYKNKLKFPDASAVSGNAQDLMKNLLTDQGKRFRWRDICQHVFFSGIAWADMEQASPPFIPTISGLDDTSNFEEVEKVKPQPNMDDFKVNKDFSGKHLPFVGFTYIRDVDDLCYCKCHDEDILPKKVLTTSDNKSSLSTALWTAKDSTNLEVTLTVKVSELRFLKQRCSELEKSEFKLKSELDMLKRECDKKDARRGASDEADSRLERDVDTFMEKTKRLSKQLTTEVDERRNLERQAEAMYLQIRDMTQEAQGIQDELSVIQVEDLQDIISQLEMENENLLRHLRQKDRQMHAVTNTLTDTQNQLTHVQIKLDKERRKSRDDQKRDLVMLENRDDTWKQQLEHKQETIDKLNSDIRDLEDLVEAYEQQDKEYADEIESLHNKMNTSLRETTGVIIPASVTKTGEMGGRKLELCVTLKTGRRSFLNNSYLEEKIQGLVALVDHYSEEARAWKHREDNLRETIQTLRQQDDSEAVRSQKKENLFQHLKLYQQEVLDQKKLIKELQTTMKGYLDKWTVKSTDLKLRVQNLETEKQSLEVELEREQECGEEHRSLLDKQNKELEEMSALIAELQQQTQALEKEKQTVVEEYSARLDQCDQKLNSEKQNMERKISFLEDEIVDLQRQLDDMADQLRSAERRLTESKSQMQQLHEQRSDLKVRMESLQRKSASHDEDLNERAKLNARIDSLEQEVEAVEKKLDAATDQKDALERKVKNLEKDREDLKVRVRQLEDVKQQKAELERKVSRLERVEQEKKSVEEKLDSLRSVSREKQDLEVKVTRLERAQKDKDRVEKQLQEVEKEKRELDRKVTRLERREKDQDVGVERLENEKSSLEEKIHRLEKVEAEKQDLQLKVIRLQRLEAEVGDLKDRLKVMEGRETEKSEKLTRTAREKIEAESRVEELTAEKKRLEEKIQTLNQIKVDLEKAEGEKRDLEDKVRKLQRTMTDLEKAEGEKRDLEDKVRKLQRTTTDLEKAESDKKNLEGKVRNLENAKMNLEGEKKDLEDKVRKLQSLKTDLQLVEGEKKDLEIKVIRLERLENENKDLETKLKDLEKGKFDVEKSEGERRRLEKKVSEYEKMEVEKRSLERKLRKVELEKEDLETSRVEKRLLQNKVVELEKMELDKKNIEEKLRKTENEKRELERYECEKKELEVKVNFLINLENENKQLETQVNELAKLEKEKSALEERLKNVENQKDVLEKKVSEMDRKSRTESRRSLVDRLQSEKSELQRRVEVLEKDKDDLNRVHLNKRMSMHENDLKKAKSDLEDKVQRLERVTRDMEQELGSSKEQNGRDVQVLKTRVESLVKENAALRGSLGKPSSKVEKTSSVKTDSEKESDNELQRVRNSLKRTKSFAVPKDKEVSDLEQEKRYLEAKVNSLQKQVDQKTPGGSGVGKTAEAESLREDNARLEERVKQLTDATAVLQKELENLLEQTEGIEDLKDQNERLEAELVAVKKRLESVGSGTMDMPLAEVRRELNESNLALSEARSLLAAMHRQEQELRDQIHQKQRQLDNQSMERGVKVNNSQPKECLVLTKQVAKRAADDKEQELSLLKSKYAMFARQNKTLEEKLIKLQKERSLDILELAKVQAQINDKNRQIDLEVKKVEKFRGVCKELEDQMKDLELLVREYDRREAEWKKIRKTYEQAVDEREEELEGTSQKLSIIEQARSATSEQLSKLRHQLKSAKAAHKAEVEALNHQLWEERGKVHKLQLQVSEIASSGDKSEQILARQKQIIDTQDTDKIKLKEEISKILTENQELRTSNLRLRKTLDEAMDKFELIFGEKIDLENFTEAMQGLHFLEKYKFESTIGQQMKLIDYLQELWHDSMSKKKRPGKLFGSMRSKDGPPVIPAQWKEFQASLEGERKKNSRLQEQLDRVRNDNFQLSNELLKLKGPLREKMILEGVSTLTPKTKAAVSALAKSPSSQHDPGVLAPDCQAYVMSAPPTPQHKQRMHHHIPHRFTNGLNTRATKCAVCLGSVHFVKQAAKCQECHIVCHPRCVTSVPASCGLPTEYVRHYTDMMARVNRDPVNEFGEEIEDPVNAIHMESYIKIPRNGKPGWEKRYVTLDGTWLMVYNDKGDGNPIDTLELNPAETDVSIHSAVTSAELSGTASTDLHYVLRIDQDPLTTCWPGRVMYLMALTFPEKQRWVATLEAAVKGAQRGEAFRKSRIKMDTVVAFSERKEVNCSLVLSKQLVLLGAEEGLFAVNPQSPVTSDKLLIPLTGITNIHQMTLAAGLGLVIMITGFDRRVILVEKSVIKHRLSQCQGGETAPLPYRQLDGVQGCTVLDVGMWQDSTYLCLGMIDRVVLMKYNTSLGMFCVRKEFESHEPCSCVCMAENFTLVGTEKFYKISLDHPSMLDFVDRQDSSLAFAAFGAANHHSYPLAVIQVSPAGLPLEFLLCFHEFGVFVDDKGRRSRPLDVKWSGLPLSFVYREPFLYITYFNCIQATVVPACKQEVKGRQTIIDLQSPRYLGTAATSGSVYILACNNGAIEMLSLRGLEEHDTTATRQNSQHGSDSGQVRFVSPNKGFKSRQRLSLTSSSSESSSS